jgi:hypothetical protein
MDLYLTRQGDNRYMLTKNPPVITEVDGWHGKKEPYCTYGDPVALRNTCSTFWRNFGIRLKPLETCKIRLEVERTDSDGV